MDDKFYEELFEQLKNAVGPDGGHIHEVDIRKCRESIPGLRIYFDGRPEELTVCPGLYYLSYEQDCPMNEIIDNIQKKITDILHEPNGINHMTCHLHTAIVNFDENKDWITQLPHEHVADMAVFMKQYFVDGESVNVDYAMLTDMHMTKEEAFSVAKETTRQDMEFLSMEDLITQMVINNGMDMECVAAAGEFVPDAPVYVLSNESGIDGAALIADTQILNSIRKKLDDDIYILPSSTHEALILPQAAYKNTNDIQEVLSVSGMDRPDTGSELSDRIYEFDGHSLKLAGTELTHENNIADTITHHRSR